jgi:hypothetical protein
MRKRLPVSIYLKIYFVYPLLKIYVVHETSSKHRGLSEGLF